jgi:hypothetical protein
MADPILQYGTTPYSAMDPRPDFARTDLQSAAGLGAFGPSPTRVTLADIEVEQQQALDRIAGLGVDAAPRLRPPPEASKQMAPGPGIYYSPGLDRFAVGDIEFGRQDYDIALQAAPLAGRRTGRPTTPGDWQEISPSRFGEYIASISEGRGFFGNVGMGFRDVGEGVVGGVGRGLQMLGAEGAGQALVGVGEFLGPTAADEARDAAIRERQGLLGQIGTAAARSIPTLGLAIAGGVGGGALFAGGLRAAAAGGAVARAGQLAGVSATIFPMEVQSSYTAAQQGGYDVNDLEVQSDIWATAAIKTLAQTLPEAFLAGAFSRAFGTALRDASRRTILNTVGPIVGVGSAEAVAETFATLADRVMFDPELRAEFNERDWAALAPLIIEKYGEEGFVAAGAGFLLGGGFRAAIMPFEGGRTPPPQRNLDTDEPVDVLSGTTIQALPTPEERLGLPFYPEGEPVGAQPAGLLPPPPAALPAPDRSARSARSADGYLRGARGTYVSGLGAGWPGSGRVRYCRDPAGSAHATCHIGCAARTDICDRHGRAAQPVAATGPGSGRNAAGTGSPDRGCTGRTRGCAR